MLPHVLLPTIFFFCKQTRHFNTKTLQYQPQPNHSASIPCVANIRQSRKTFIRPSYTTPCYLASSHRFHRYWIHLHNRSRNTLKLVTVTVFSRPPTHALSSVASPSSHKCVVVRANQTYSKRILCHHDVNPWTHTVCTVLTHTPAYNFLPICVRVTLFTAHATCYSPSLRCFVCHAEISPVAFHLSAEAFLDSIPYQPYSRHQNRIANTYSNRTISTIRTA